MTDKAIEFGNHKLANMVSLGVLSETEKELNLAILEKAVDMVLPEERKHLLKSNVQAIELGTSKQSSLV